jgi:hypothetical protein
VYVSSYLPLGLFPCKIIFSGNPSPEEQRQKAMRREGVGKPEEIAMKARTEEQTGVLEVHWIFLLLLDHSYRKDDRF